MPLCACVYVCTCMHVGIHVFVDGWMYMYVRIFMCMRMHVCMSICVDMYAYDVHMYDTFKTRGAGRNVPPTCLKLRTAISVEWVAYAI